MHGRTALMGLLVLTACSAEPAPAPEMLNGDDDEPALGCFAFGPCDGIRDSSAGSVGDTGVDAGVDADRDAELAELADAGAVAITDAALVERDAAVDSSVVGPEEINECGGMGALICACGGPCTKGSPCSAQGTASTSFGLPIMVDCGPNCAAQFTCNPGLGQTTCPARSYSYSWKCAPGEDGQWMTQLVCTDDNYEPDTARACRTPKLDGG